MKLSTLITHLKRLDPNSQVVWRSHDQSPNESDGALRYAEQADEEFFEGNINYDGSKPVVILGP